MKELIFFLTLTASLSAQNGDIEVGYYHLDKHLPKLGLEDAQCFIDFRGSYGTDRVCEKFACDFWDTFVCDGYLTFPLSVIRWRYHPEHVLGNDPFDEYITWHSTLENPPDETQIVFYVDGWRVDLESNEIVEKKGSMHPGLLSVPNSAPYWREIK